MGTREEELNERIANPRSCINNIKGFEIIAETMVYKIYDVFGRNSLLSILYQTGSGAGEIISERLKKKYGKEEFEILEAFEKLMTELTEFHSVEVKKIEEDDKKLRILFENHCFLREPIKHRKRLKFGSSFCRVNKGYFEIALKNMLGNKVKKVTINFIQNDDEKDACMEELVFEY